MAFVFRILVKRLLFLLFGHGNLVLVRARNKESVFNLLDAKEFVAEKLNAMQKRKTSLKLQRAL
jgi:hypothetical protein